MVTRHAGLLQSWFYWVTVLIRLPEWEPSLDAVIAASRYVPFEYGRHDCATFVGACISAMTGIQLGEHLRTYHSKEQASVIIERFGSLANLWTAILGVEPIAAIDARKGDVVIADMRRLDGQCGFVSGVSDGRRFWSTAYNGVRPQSMALATHTWRIG